MDFQLSVVFDKTQFAESVHEKTHARSGRADHLRQCFLAKLSHDRLRPTFLAEICKQKEKSSEALFARIE
jgi:BarA-like signal transduction histidine kinase